MILPPTRALKAALCLCLGIWTCAAPALEEEKRLRERQESHQVDAAGVSCELWNIDLPDFFSLADATDVARCLRAGGDPNERDTFGTTPLHIAAGVSTITPAVVKVLLDAGAQANARDKNGWTSLHYAAAASRTPAVVAALAKGGAGVNALAKDGKTPLHAAAIFSETPAVVKALLDAGANPTAKDESGKTPFDLAKANAALKGTEVLRRLGEER